MDRLKALGAARLTRTEAGLVFLAVIALAVQLSGISLIGTAEPVIGTAEPVRSGAPIVIWRDFRPGQHLVETPSGRICGAALQRGTGAAVLIVHFCTDVPTTPVRRFGLGYDVLVLEASLPGGGRLSYSLLEFAAQGTDRGRSFAQRPTSDNMVLVRAVFVRDATDLVVVLDTDLPAGLPSVGVRGSLRGVSFSEVDPFEPLGAGSDEARLELEHALSAPSWAKKERP